MAAWSFRTKLLLAMLLLVSGVTGATLLATKQLVERSYSQVFARQFEQQSRHFAEQRALRLETLRQNTRRFAEGRFGVRVRAALEALGDGPSPEDVREFYNTVKDDVPGFATGERDRGQVDIGRASFFRCLTPDGHLLEPADEADAGPFLLEEFWRSRIRQATSQLALPDQRTVAYLPVRFASSDAESTLHEVIFTPIPSADGDRVTGLLMMGLPLPSESAAEPVSGLWLDGRLYGGLAAASYRSELERELAGRLHQPGPLDFDLGLRRLFLQPLESGLGGDVRTTPQLLVAVSTREEHVAEAELRTRILWLGAGGVLAAFLLSLLLSHGFTVPIRELAAGTREIERGNLAIQLPVHSQDELGALTRSFNAMVEGLALKEKYRSVLDRVTDRAVAQELVRGELKLGGEKRDVSVLFCDIRGFTAHTQDMDPADVIAMLNEHMTALTDVASRHHGVVDKFVGDLIMVVFGAPKSYGRDAEDALLCAWEMIAARQQLNETSLHHIEIGIGIATGPAVAGNMGSANRSNYTVLGERVNLASRLCSKAGRMQIVIDPSTAAAVDSSWETEAMPELELKGFSARVQAFLVRNRRVSIPAPQTALLA